MKLKLGISITFISNIIFALSQWLLIAGLNYTGNTDTVGQYAYTLALSGLFLTFGQFGIRPYLLSKNITAHEERYVFQTRVITSLLSLLLLYLYSYFFVEAIYFTLIVIMGLIKLVENFSDICHGFFQKNFLIINIAKSRVLRSLLTPLLFLSIYLLTNNIVFACLGILLSLLLVYYFIDKAAFSQQKENADTLSIKLHTMYNLAKHAFPMGIAVMLVMLITSLPLFVLSQHYSDQETGFYASIFYFVTAGSLILQSAMQVISPILTKNIKEENKKQSYFLIRRSYFYAIAFGVSGLLLAVLLGDFILAFLYGSSFSDKGNLLVIAAFINLVLALQSVGGIVLTSLGVFKYQMYIMVITLIICYIASQYLISTFAIAGALYTGILTGTFVALAFFLKIIKEL